jgi:rhamnose utilization protein RhaD (predicted bifunctional aldolase and dehydrogenase)
MFFINFVQKPVFAADATKVTQQIKTGIENFPKTYQTYLKELKELHPNWNFDAYYTGIEWNESRSNR